MRRHRRTPPDLTGVAPSRRGLTAGAVGLVVGSSALTGTSPAAFAALPPAPSPGEELMTEHGVLKRVLLAYRAVSGRLAHDQHVPYGAVLDAAQIVADYVESFHEGLEEAYVFPRVAPAHPDLVRTLLVQHDRGRHLTAAIKRAASADLSGQTRGREALRRYLDQFVAMYEPHEAWEDTVIYPALRATTSARTLDELAERFASLEAKRYSDDALETILGRVSGVEEQLGIADLDAFTPPLPGQAP